MIKSKVEIFIERNFTDPSERLVAMQTYEDMVNYLRAEKAKWVLVYVDVLEPTNLQFSYVARPRIVWKFQIQDEDVLRRFDLLFSAP